MTISSDAMIRELLERMAPLQEVSIETGVRLNEIKQEGRSDGLNLEAINALLPILVRHPHDKGANVINEMIRYAEAYGAEGIVSSNSAAVAPVDAGAPAGAPPETASAPTEDSAPSGPALAQAAKAQSAEDSGVPNRLAEAAARWLTRIDPARRRMAGQAALGLCVTAGLLWMLH